MGGNLAAEYSYVQDTREAGCYNMVYHFPPNSTTGITNGHLSLVTPPQHHGDSNEATPTSMHHHEHGWQASAWIPTTACSNATNLVENQHHYTTMNSGFATPTEAEMALAGQGKNKKFLFCDKNLTFFFAVKAESKPIVLEPKPTPYLQHLHNLTTVPHHPLNLENNNTVELVDGNSSASAHHNSHIDEDSKDPLACHNQEISATAAVTQETHHSPTIAASETSQFYP